MLDYENLNQQEILDRIMSAKLYQELEDTVGELLQKIQKNNGEEPKDSLIYKTCEKSGA